MEQATQPQLSRQYDLPPERDDNMSPADAEKALAKRYADMADPQHPGRNKNSPLHKYYAEDTRKLHEIASDGLTPTERAMKEAMEHGEQKRAKQSKAAYDSAVIDRDAYVAAGGAHLDVPANIQPGQAKCLKMLRICQEGNLNEIIPLMQASGRDLNISAETMQSYIDVTQDENISKEMKQNFIEGVLADLSVQYKKMSTPRPKKIKMEPKPYHLRKTPLPAGTVL